MKCLRIFLILKYIYKELYGLVHPHAVTVVKLGKRTVYPETMASIWGFFMLYLMMTVVATIIMAMLGLDMMTAFSPLSPLSGMWAPDSAPSTPQQPTARYPIWGNGYSPSACLPGGLKYTQS